MPCRFPGPHPRGKFRGIWPGGVSRPIPKVEVEGDLVQVHTQGGSLGGSGQGGLQAYTQGGSWGGSGPGPHPRGKLRGIWSRPTPKVEVEGDLVQAHTQGGSWGGSGWGVCLLQGVSDPRGVYSRGHACSQGGVCSWGFCPGGGCGDPPPPWRLLLQAVRILLECILVSSN